MSSLEMGGEAGSNGAVTRSYSKYGHRMYTAVATMVSNPMNHIKGIACKIKAGLPHGVDSKTRRAKTY